MSANSIRFLAVVRIAGTALGLWGCTSAGDHLMGVEGSRATPTTCIRQCNDLNRALVAAEDKQHMTQIENCQSQEEGTRAQCFDAESMRHSAEIERLSQGLSDCQRSCVRSGG